VLDGGPAKLLAAVTEAEAELDEREAQTRADDDKRSADLGEVVESGQVYVAIEKLRAKLGQARDWRSANFPQAIGALHTAIGS